MAESVTITDNRTGESVEVPIVNGGVDSAAWSKLMPGTFARRWTARPVLDANLPLLGAEVAGGVINQKRWWSQWPGECPDGGCPERRRHL